MYLTGECLRGLEGSKRLVESLAVILAISLRIKTANQGGQKQLILKPRLTHLDGLKRKGGGLRPKPEPSAQGADG